MQAGRATFKPGSCTAHVERTSVPLSLSSAAYAAHVTQNFVLQNARRAGSSAERSFQEEEEFFAKYERNEDEAARAQEGAVNPADDMTADQNDDMNAGYGVWHSSRQVRWNLCLWKPCKAQR